MASGGRRRRCATGVARRGHAACDVVARRKPLSQRTAQHRVKPTPPSAAAKQLALSVVPFGEGGLVSEGRAARLTQVVSPRPERDSTAQRARQSVKTAVRPVAFGE